MKVCMVAYAAAPGEGSEPGVGYNFANAASEIGRVHLLTRENNLLGLDGLRKQGIALHGIDLNPLMRRLKNVVPFGVQIYYCLWYRKAMRYLEILDARESFEIVHHVSFAADWLPGPRLKNSDAAIVWGPVAGATYANAASAKWLGITGSLAEVLRFVVTWLMRLVFGRRAAKNADYVVFGSSDSQVALREFAQAHCVETNIVLTEDLVHVSAAEADRGRAAQSCDGVRLITASRLTRWKGVDLAIRAVSLLSEEYRIDIFGSGRRRELRRLERLARRLNVGSRVTFRGHVPREVFLHELGAADVYIAASLHESIGWATAEAIAHGVKVVATARGGHLDTVEGATACRLVPVSRRLPQDLASSIVSVVETTSVGSRTDRWSAARLPALIDGWYASAREASQHRRSERGDV